MFVRFRKLPCDGFEPGAAADPFIACRRPWNGPKGPVHCRHGRGHCRLKPRCRWRIGGEEALAPYRLKVVLVENKRVNGKVKQETIAVLGSIEATWLPEFWEGIDKEKAAKLKTDRWELYSLRERFAFWKIANRRLKKLSNRLGPDAKRIRMAAHARVPYPMEAGKKRLELLEAKKDFDSWRDLIKIYEGRIASHKKIIKSVEQEIAEDKETVRKYTFHGSDAATKLAKLSTRSRP